MTYNTAALPTVEALVEAMKADIRQGIADGMIPASVENFSQLHDYVDANMLGYDLIPEPADDEDDDEAEERLDATVEIMNPAQAIVSEWLGARGLAFEDRYL